MYLNFIELLNLKLIIFHLSKYAQAAPPTKGKEEPLWGKKSVFLLRIFNASLIYR